MPPTTDAAIDVAVVQPAVGRALAIGPGLPRYEELNDLVAELRGHLQVLLSVIRAGRQARAATARGELERGPGRGMRSAVDHARLPALDCRWALRHLTSAAEVGR
ncbi:DUF6415 family natural product biosynthesis protein [Streptomyces sp. URMC 125]|uniref:DUF6415 family natural product biosynthesis protein n=1 Tax=Streptomyces sp. URMC 125 TaxID=3423419 RepID=UPI003F19B8E9